MAGHFGVGPHPAHGFAHEELRADDQAVHPVPHPARCRERKGRFGGRGGDRGFGAGWQGLGIFCGQPGLFPRRGAEAQRGTRLGSTIATRLPAESVGGPRKSRRVLSGPGSSFCLVHPPRPCASARDHASASQSNVARVVGLGPLILFSSGTGDAWLLDWQDESALCLASHLCEFRASVRATPTVHSMHSEIVQAFWHPFRCDTQVPAAGGIALLNPRLRSGIPPGCWPADARTRMWDYS